LGKKTKISDTIRVTLSAPSKTESAAQVDKETKRIKRKKGRGRGNLTEIHSKLSNQEGRDAHALRARGESSIETGKKIQNTFLSSV